MPTISSLRSILAQHSHYITAAYAKNTKVDEQNHPRLTHDPCELVNPIAIKQTFSGHKHIVAEYTEVSSLRDVLPPHW